MNDDVQSELFNIRVTEISKKYIRKLYSVGLVSFILNNSLTAIVISIAVYNIVGREALISGSIKETYFFIYPFYAIAYSALSVVANYFYFSFLRKIRHSVLNADEKSYNLSFKYAYINVLIFMISTILGLIFVILDVLVLLS